MGKNSQKSLILGLATALSFFALLTFSKSILAQSVCPIDTSCVCHNVENNPHTICVGDPGFDNHLKNHISDGQDACGACCENGACDTADGEDCSICPEDCGECTPVCPDGDNDADGVCNSDDNCPDNPNPLQEDADEDGFGDVCDDCVGDNNIDTDDNGVPDACQEVTETPTPSPSPTPPTTETPTGLFLNGGESCSLNAIATPSLMGAWTFFLSVGALTLSRLMRRK